MVISKTKFMVDLKYCKICVLPSTKPHIKFDSDGVCAACLFHLKKNFLSVAY